MPPPAVKLTHMLKECLEIQDKPAPVEYRLSDGCTLGINTEGELEIKEKGKAILKTAPGMIETSMGTETPIRKRVQVHVEENGHLQLTYPTDNQNEYMIELWSDESRPGIFCTAKWKNEGDSAVSLQRINPLLWTIPEEDFTSLRISHPNYQSWGQASMAAVLNASHSHHAPAPFKSLQQPRPGLHYFDNAAGISTQNEYVFAGAVTAFRFSSQILIDPEKSQAHLSCITENTMVSPGQSLISETFFISSRRSNENADIDNLSIVQEIGEFYYYQEYGRHIAQMMGKRTLPSEALYLCTWYEAFQNVTPQYVRNNIHEFHALRQELNNSGPAMMIIDDGWQDSSWYWHPNDKFIGQMGKLSEETSKAGIVPGVWVAPFAVPQHSLLYQEHPNWIIRDSEGNPVVTKRNVWGGDVYGLDLSREDVQEHVRQIFKRIKNEWNFPVVKMDFLYCGAAVGVRHDPMKTGVELIREEFRQIREIMGEDAILIACGSPILPAAGLIDVMRIGTDTIDAWVNENNNSDGTPSGLKYTLQTLLANAWMRQIFTPDQDCIIARKHDSRLTESEVHTLILILKLLGGAVGLGDDLTKLEPERKDLLRIMNNIPTGQFVPVSVSPEGLPDTFLIYQTQEDKPTHRGIINWKDYAQSYHAGLDEFSLPAHASTLLPA